MRKKQIIKVMIPVAALILCGIIVLLERYGVTNDYIQTYRLLETSEFTEDVTEEKTCLMLTSEEEVSAIYEEMMDNVLDGMEIGYDTLFLNDGLDGAVLDDYDTVVITFQEWKAIGEGLPALFEWVQDGGKLMTTVTPIVDGSFGAVKAKLGIISLGDSYPEVRGFRMLGDCMIGASEDEVFWYALEDEEGLTTSLQVELDEECKVWMESEDGSVPLIWSRDYGEGRVAIVNEAIAEKYQRGFLGLVYSLLDDVSIYPVINGSAFYLDDFPSPVPQGNGEYIKRDYGVDIATFYSTVWWPKVLEWEETYGIAYTGLIIEMYSDDVEIPFERNDEETQFLTFGNMLLNRGGELGFHGYNHMPLCVEGIDDNRQFGEYELWESTEAIKASIEELDTFSKELFPDSTFQVYVPPSNIMSETGKEALLKAAPSIRVIASTYLKDAEDKVYEQEFEVDEDGIIHTPRVVSGCDIDNYQKICALSELNLRYVQSHFMHPDDVLDEDRGADAGWEAMSATFESYLDWVYTSAPNIRNVTGSEMGVAVQQYDALTMCRSYEKHVLTVELGGFSGEASFLLRVNEGEIADTEGCTYEHVTGNLYVIQANTDKIKIYLGE